MASSNRHWPSMFKTKTCNSHHHPWHHDINSSSSSSCQKPPLSSSSSGSSEETTSMGRSPPEPKPRWNPRPEQIRILESIFNSGTVNPSRDDIRKIRGQLQEYGQVGDANVFYWFQNRKSRTKHKQQRHLHHKPTTTTTITKTTTPTPPPPAPAPISSSITTTTTTPQYYSLNLPNFHQNDFLKVPILPPLQGFSFPPPPSPSPADHHHLLDHTTIDNCSSNFLLSDLLLGFSTSGCKNGEEIQQNLLSFDHQSNITTTTVLPTPRSTTTTTATNIAAAASAATLSNIHHTQCDIAGGIMQCPIIKSSIVFINDVEFEVTTARPFNVKEAFGDDAILIHASGQPVLTNEWGVALEPLHHGGFYYLIRPTLSHLHSTII